MTEQHVHVKFQSLNGGCTGSSESTLVKNATLLEISCRGSYTCSFAGYISMCLISPFLHENLNAKLDHCDINKLSRSLGTGTVVPTKSDSDKYFIYNC